MGASPDTPLKDVKNFCKVVQGAYKKERTLEVSVRESTLLRGPGAGQIVKIPPIWPTLSLEDLLASGQDLRPYHRVVLALNLAHGLLRIYRSGVQSPSWEWTTRDIYFLVCNTKDIIYEAYNPYVAHSLSLQHRNDGEKDGQLAGSIKFSILISFAKLLLEIALGRSLGPFGRRLDVALLELADESDLQLTENVGQRYIDAILVCLESNYDDDDDDDDDDDEEEEGAGKRDEETQCRHVILAAVRALEDARNKGFPARKDARKDPRRDPNYPYRLELVKVAQAWNASRQLSHPSPPATAPQIPPAASPAPSGRDLPSFGSHNQMFDDRKLGIGAEDSRALMAEDFLNSTEQFYAQHIRALPSTRNIRIAILDTGIVKGDSFFRTVRRSRRARDDPIVEAKSFVGEPEEDRFGHGTNVAALILKMAPEADLYIAKIAHEQEVDGADQIAEVRDAMAIDSRSGESC